MDKKYVVTKNFRNVLPKIKGYKWEIYYSSRGSILGNVSIYLWSKKFFLVGDIVGSAHVNINESHTPEEVQEIILSGVQIALNKHKELLKGVPSNILNQSSISREK